MSGHAVRSGVHVWSALTGEFMGCTSSPMPRMPLEASDLSAALVHQVVQSPPCMSSGTSMMAAVSAAGIMLWSDLAAVDAANSRQTI